MPRILLTVLIVLGLCSCADYQARLAAQRQAQLEATNASDDAQCRNYGATPGTQNYTECRMLIANQRANIEAARDMQQQQIYSNMAIAGANILSNQAAAQQAALPPPLPLQMPVRCRSQPVGNAVQTICQ